MKPVVLKPQYFISVNEIVLFGGKKYVVQDFNVETLSFVLLSPDGTTIEAYHRKVSKINETYTLVDINCN